MTKMDKSDTHSSDDDLVWYSKGNCFAIKGVYVLTITVIDPGYWSGKFCKNYKIDNSFLLVPFSKQNKYIVFNIFKYAYNTFD